MVVDFVILSLQEIGHFVHLINCLMLVVSVPISAQRHGTGILVFPNGNTYNGDFKKNSMTGHGIMTYWNRDVYEGEFKNGLVCRLVGNFTELDLIY